MVRLLDQAPHVERRTVQRIKPCHELHDCLRPQHIQQLDPDCKLSAGPAATETEQYCSMHCPQEFVFDVQTNCLEGEASSCLNVRPHVHSDSCQIGNPHHRYFGRKRHQSPRKYCYSTLCYARHRPADHPCQFELWLLELPVEGAVDQMSCLLYTSPSPRD